MATVHKIEVARGGLSVYAMEGEQIDVHGVQMVRLRHGTIVKTAGFHARLSDAKRQAADEIGVYAAELVGRAAALRAEADAIDAKEAVG